MRRYSESSGPNNKILTLATQPVFAAVLSKDAQTIKTDGNQVKQIDRLGPRERERECFLPFFNINFYFLMIICALPLMDIYARSASVATH